MKSSRYTKLGILIVFTISVFIWGLSYLKGHDILKKFNDYHVIYQRVDGLVTSDAVTLNGFKIGQVKSINFADDSTGNLLVTFTIDESLKIPVNSVARIFSSDIMGTKSIKLIISPSKEYYNSNDTIPGAIEDDLKEQVSLQVLPLKYKAEQLLATIDSAITILTVIFNEDARDNLSESFKNINSTISNIEETSAELKNLINSESENVSNIVENLNVVSESFKGKSMEFENIITNFSAISDSLSAISFSPMVKSIADATKQIEEIILKLNSDQGTAGKLINDDQLYINLVTLTNNLDRLMKDVRLNPKRYLHFSAFDLGKEVYITSTGKNNNNKIIFKINLVSTQSKIPINSELFEGLGKIEEYSASGAYSYLLGATNDYNEILELHEKAIPKFPDSKIIAFRNGKVIKLERALKNMDK